MICAITSQTEMEVRMLMVVWLLSVISIEVGSWIAKRDVGGANVCPIARLKLHCYKHPPVTYSVILSKLRTFTGEYITSRTSLSVPFCDGNLM